VFSVRVILLHLPHSRIVMHRNSRKPRWQVKFVAHVFGTPAATTSMRDPLNSLGMPAMQEGETSLERVSEPGLPPNRYPSPRVPLHHYHPPTLCLPAKAWLSVTSSVYSRLAPTGMPRARRVMRGTLPART